MRARPNFKKLLRIAITSLLYTLFYLIVFYTLNFFFHINFPFVSLFISLTIALFFHDRVTWMVRNFIDKNFYRKIFKINQSIDQFNVELNSTLEFQIIVDRFINFLEMSFRENKWAFYYCWGEDYELFGSNINQDDLPKLIKLPVARELDKIYPKEIDFQALRKLEEKHQQFADLRKRISPDIKLYYFYPLKSYKGYLGFLLLDSSLNYYFDFPSIKQKLLRIFVKTADVLENDFLYSEVKRKSLQNYLLVEIGKQISATLDLSEVLETIIDSVKQLVSYDAGGIFLIDKNKKVLQRMVTRGYDTKLLKRLTLKLDRGLYGWVIKNRLPSIINDVSQDSNYYLVRKNTSSQLTVPLINGDQILGVMALESDKLNHFTPGDKELLMTFASQAVTAIENAQLFEAYTQKKRLESELIVASKVQNALLPERPPDFKGLKISFINIPSRIVGGDFYDIFKLSDIKLGIAIGDVSGKGAPASILMAILYAGFRSHLKKIYPVVEVVARLNNLITEITTEGYFATFFFGIYNHEMSELTFTNAGHNSPLLIRRDGSILRLTTGGIVLGFLKDQEYRQETIKLLSGDFLILFTDGVTEVMNGKGEEFGEDRLINLIQKNQNMSPHELKLLILQELKNFSAQKDFSDDVTLALIYVE
ncbi:MAG: SpoIIE family protein phosphatase [Calditrichia bacterium]|nr:SpoIIE family protein phosphatase [Calditrichia bacterium]